jgi:DNA polymerase III alpha subunit (gram-positive type)
MAKSVVFLCALLAVSHSKLLTPRDLADEAEEQLDELKSIVQGDILVAHNDLQTLQTDFLIYSDNIVKNGAIEIQQEFEAVDGQLTTIK